MQEELKHRSTDLHKSESADWTNSLIYHRQFAIRWSSECRPHRIPNEFSALSTYPLSARKCR